MDTRALGSSYSDAESAHLDEIIMTDEEIVPKARGEHSESMKIWREKKCVTKAEEFEALPFADCSSADEVTALNAQATVGAWLMDNCTLIARALRTHEILENPPDGEFTRNGLIRFVLAAFREAVEWAIDQGYPPKKIRRLQDSGDLISHYWRWQAEYGEHGENCMCEKCVT
jgi:hypothetical protein